MKRGESDREEEATPQQWQGGTLMRFRTMPERGALSKRCQLSTRSVGWQTVETQNTGYKRRPEVAGRANRKRSEPPDRFTCHQELRAGIFMELLVFYEAQFLGGSIDDSDNFKRDNLGLKFKNLFPPS